MTQARAKRSEPDVDASRAGLARRVLAIPEIAPFLAFVTVMVAVSLVDAKMLSPANLGTMARALAHSGIVAVGMAFLLISGEIDLSAGSVGTLGAVVCAYLIVRRGWGVPPALLAALLSCMLIGLVNGLITVRLGLTSFITTLGTHYLAFGIAMALAEGKEIIGLPAVLSRWSNAPILGVSPGFIVFVVLMLVGDLVLKRTTLGGMVIATGGNRLAARVAGINTDRVKIACFVLVSTLAAVAGLLTMARFEAGDVYIGRPWQLTVIAISVLGGVSLLGGVGTILGVFFGAFLVQAIRSSLVMLGVQATGQDLVIGVFLVIAATADVLRRRTTT